MVCPQCNGTKKMDCPECRGKGTVYSFKTHRDIYCPKCQGRKKITCDNNCQGDRNITGDFRGDLDHFNKKPVPKEIGDEETDEDEDFLELLKDL